MTKLSISIREEGHAEEYSKEDWTSREQDEDLKL